MKLEKLADEAVAVRQKGGVEDKKAWQAQARRHLDHRPEDREHLAQLLEERGLGSYAVLVRSKNLL